MDPRRLGRSPVLREFFVDAVAALGRLDPGELHARGAYARPVDVALVFRDVDAVHLVIGRARERILFKAAAGASRDAEQKPETKKRDQKLPHDARVACERILFAKVSETLVKTR